MGSTPASPISLTVESSARPRYLKGAKSYFAEYQFANCQFVRIKQFESCKIEAYFYPAGIPTIGYGHTKTAELGAVITEVEAEAMLKGDLKEAEMAVDRLVTVPIDENQFSALVSFVFNIGAGAFENSTLLAMLNAYASTETVAAQFLRWNKADGQELAGLTRRRHAERALFMSENWKVYLF